MTKKIKSAKSLLLDLSPIPRYREMKENLKLYREYGPKWKDEQLKAGSAEDWVEYEYVTGMRRLYAKEILGLLTMTALSMIVLPLGVLAILVAEFAKLIAQTDLGLCFPFHREAVVIEHELYNRHGRVFPKGFKGGPAYYDGLSIEKDARDMCITQGSYRFEGLTGKWHKVSLRSEAAKPETDEMLIAEYLRFDKSESVIYSVYELKLYFMGFNYYNHRYHETLHVEF